MKNALWVCSTTGIHLAMTGNSRRTQAASAPTILAPLLPAKPSKSDEWRIKESANCNRFRPSRP